LFTNIVDKKRGVTKGSGRRMAEGKLTAGILTYGKTILQGWKGKRKKRTIKDYKIARGECVLPPHGSSSGRRARQQKIEKGKKGRELTKKVRGKTSR